MRCIWGGVCEHLHACCRRCAACGLGTCLSATPAWDRTLRRSCRPRVLSEQSASIQELLPGRNCGETIEGHVLVSQMQDVC